MEYTRNEEVSKYSQEITNVAINYYGETRIAKRKRVIKPKTKAGKYFLEHLVNKFGKENVEKRMKRIYTWWDSVKDVITIATPVLLSSSLLTYNYLGNPFYHLSGCISSGVGRMLDINSALKFSKEMDDTRFWEYGLDEHFGEAGLLLPEHPKEEDFVSKKIIVAEGVITLLNSFAPPGGYAVVVVGGYLHHVQSRYAKEIKLTKEIGDNIKELVENGSTDEDIENYLKELMNSKELVKDSFDL